MNPAAKLAAFALALAVASGVGAALGAAVGPLGDGRDGRPVRSTTTTMPATMDMDHAGR